MNSEALFVEYIKVDFYVGIKKEDFYNKKRLKRKRLF